MCRSAPLSASRWKRSRLGLRIGSTCPQREQSHQSYRSTPGSRKRQDDKEGAARYSFNPAREAGTASILSRLFVLAPRSLGLVDRCIGLGPRLLSRSSGMTHLSALLDHPVVQYALIPTVGCCGHAFCHVADIPVDVLGGVTIISQLSFPSLPPATPSPPPPQVLRPLTSSPTVIFVETSRLTVPTEFVKPRLAKKCLFHAGNVSAASACQT